MVRILNFVCVAMMGFTILALYHVSEKTRMAHMELAKANAGIVRERGAIGVLETEWQHVASPERIQQLASARLGMADSASVQLSSFDQLPRRGAEPAPVNNTPLRNASAEAPATDTNSGPNSGQ
jgi:hypothetical protein